jgi:hypothetical protein
MVALQVVPTVDETNRHQILAELQRIEDRLNDGYAKIDNAVERGRDVERWEALWLSLLDEYERLYRELAA